MQWATDFYANHLLIGLMDARWSENADYCFLAKKCIVLCPQLTISATNGFQTNIERLKMCLSNILYVSNLYKAEINLIFGRNFENVTFCIFRPADVHGTV